MSQAIIATNADSFSRVFVPEVREALARRVRLADGFYSAEVLSAQPALLREVEYLFTSWYGPRLDEDFLRAAPRLRAVFHAAGSVRPLVTPAFWERGIPITSAQEANGAPVADFAYAQILLALKGYWRLSRDYRAAGRIPPDRKDGPGSHRAVVGVISLGCIARRLLRLLGAHRLEILSYDPYVDVLEAAKLGVRLCGLDELFARSDVVSCHAPLNGETINLVEGRYIDQMKRGATFINTARGQVVDNVALCATLRERPDLTALLDVTWPEPLPSDWAGWTLPNLIVSPHIAGSVGNECALLGEAMVAELDRFQAGQPLVGALGEEAVALST